MYNSNERIVALIDFLGFKSFNQEQDIATKEKFIAFLKDIKKWDGNTVVIQQGNNNYCLTRSFFSDSLVLSWSVDSDDPFSKCIFIPMMLEVAKIAIRALYFGLLVRGAITFGECYHEDGIFFGKALDEAYYLESEIANYPRIIISNELLQRNLIMTTQSQNPCEKMLLKDFDHINYLNYLCVFTFRQAFWP
ncbi:MAG: hypothetical protein MUE72_12905 [Chitinophagaceae bacterium]|jgi:hypothetical protein|nr:hypothetical protein [Chitinophagaceae bacterium]